jgi:hypothetical protein
LPLDERLERQLQHPLVGDAGGAVRLARLGLPEQRQELAGDGDVEAALRGGQGVNRGSSGHGLTIRPRFEYGLHPFGAGQIRFYG